MGGGYLQDTTVHVHVLGDIHLCKGLLHKLIARYVNFFSNYQEAKPKGSTRLKVLVNLQSLDFLHSHHTISRTFNLMDFIVIMLYIGTYEKFTYLATGFQVHVMTLYIISPLFTITTCTYT